MFDERVFPYSPQGGFRYFKGHFRTRWCLRCVFCSVMHHCVVRRSGSVPTEITEPTLEARSSRHVFIETLQSKDFLAILLICGNFQITAFRVHSSLEAKNHIENRATSETVWAQFIFWCAKFEFMICNNWQTWGDISLSLQQSIAEKKDSVNHKNKKVDKRKVSYYWENIMSKHSMCLLT